jgi:hypothetical protein
MGFIFPLPFIFLLIVLSLSILRRKGEKQPSKGFPLFLSKLGSCEFWEKTLGLNRAYSVYNETRGL